MGSDVASFKEQPQDASKALMEMLGELSQALEELQNRNKSLSKAVRRSKSRVSSLEVELQETLNRLDGLRRENAGLTETLHRGEGERTALQGRAQQLEAEYSAISKDLDAILTSPGWKLISSYRDWLQRSIWTEPWLRKPYEAVAQWVLGAGCQGRSKFGPLRRSKSRPVGEGVAVFVGRLERSLRSPFRAAQA